MTKNDLKLTETDCKPMTLYNKGEILALNEQGFSIKDISGMVNRSMDWVRILIGALRGSDVEKEFIKRWNERSEDTEEALPCVGLKLHTTRKNKSSNYKRRRKNGNSTLSGRSKAMRIEGGYTPISSRRVQRHKPVLQPENRDDRSTNKSRSGNLVKTLRKSKDYVGE